MNRRHRTPASRSGPAPRWPLLLLVAILAAACQTTPDAAGEVLDFTEIATLRVTTTIEAVG